VLEPLFETRRRLYGPSHEDTLLAENNLASALTRHGERDRAAQLFEEVLEHQATKLGDDHPRTLATMNNLAGSYSALGRNDEAREMLERVLEIKRRVLEPEHPSIVTTLYTLGDVLIKLERFDEADEFLSDALEGARNAYGQNHLRTATVLNALGKLEHERGRSSIAVERAEESMAVFEALGQGGHTNMLILRSNRARYLLGAGEAELALREVEDVLEEAIERLGADAGVVMDCERTRGRALAAVGRSDEAVADLVEAYERIVARAGSDDKQAIRHAETLRDLFTSFEQDDEARVWGERAATPELGAAP